MKRLILMLILETVINLNLSKAKLLGNTAAQPAPNAFNRIMENATIPVPLKHLNNFWRSHEMPLINCKVELKLKWKKYCVFFQVVMVMQMLIMIILVLL